MKNITTKVFLYLFVMGSSLSAQAVSSDKIVCKNSRYHEFLGRSSEVLSINLEAEAFVSYGYGYAGPSSVSARGYVGKVETVDGYVEVELIDEYGDSSLLRIDIDREGRFVERSRFMKSGAVHSRYRYCSGLTKNDFR